MLPCAHALILLKGLQVLDSVLYRLDLVRHDKLHPCKTSVANLFFGEKSMPCMILFPLLSWVCMLCDTCSVPFPVLCTRRLIHVAPTMRDHLVYYE